MSLILVFKQSLMMLIMQSLQQILNTNQLVACHQSCRKDKDGTKSLWQEGTSNKYINLGMIVVLFTKLFTCECALKTKPVLLQACDLMASLSILEVMVCKGSVFPS